MLKRFKKEFEDLMSEKIYGWGIEYLLKIDYNL